MSNIVKKVKSHIFTIITDVKIQRLIVVAIGMLVCNIFMWIDSGHEFEPMIRICYCILFFPMILIFGKKWIPFQYLIIAFSVLYFNRWYNPISFVLVSVVAIKHRKFMVPLFIMYGLAVMICLGIGHRSWRHGAWHMFFCVWWYYIIIDIKNELNKKFYVTVDERNIIKQLAEGKKKKEVDGFCQNTIYEKLKNARERNGVENNAELVELYIQDSEKINL